MVVRWLLLLLVPVSILMVPVPSGLTPLAWKIFAVYIAAILGLILRPAGEAVVMLSVIAFGSFIVPVGQLLSGYGNGTVWLVFTAFLITQAFADTGLGRRVAYWMIGRFGKSSLGLVYGQMLTDLILSPATPSNTARSGGIVYPIFRNVASTLNSEPEDNPRRIGSYITISGYAISLSTSAVFLTACAPNILTVGFARDILKVDISWMDWFIGLAFPALLACLVVPYLIYKVYPPELKEISNHKELSAQGLREIGPMTANNGAWNTLIWYGAIMGISGILSKAKFFVWLAKVVGEHMNFVGVNQALVMGILLVISILVRYVFASMGAYVGAFIPVLFTLGLVAQVPPLPLVFLLGASSAYGCLLTHYGGAVGPVLFGTGYVPQKTWWKIGAVLVAFNFVLYMTVGLGYWKVLGLW